MIINKADVKRFPIPPQILIPMVIAAILIVVITFAAKDSSVQNAPIPTPSATPEPLVFNFEPTDAITASIQATYVKVGNDFISGVMENRNFDAFVLYDPLEQVLRIESKEGGEEALELNVNQTQQFIVGKTYTATRYPFNPQGTNGMDLHGFGRGCNQISGEFSVNWLGQTELYVSFTQHCEGSKDSYLIGSWTLTFRPGDLYNLPAATESVPNV